MKIGVLKGGLYVFASVCFLVSCSPSEVLKETIVEVESLSVNEASVSLSEDETVTLLATVVPADATVKIVTWNSSDERVATVNNGVVRAISPGTATITAKSLNGKTAGCVVTVAGKITRVEVESIEIDKKKLTLVIGTSSKLTAEVKPVDATDKTVTWESGNMGVATVDEQGLVMAVAAGETKITARSGNCSVTCDVTVIIQRIPAIKVELNKTAVSLTEGSTETLEAVVSPDNTTDTVVWSSRNTQIAAIDNNGRVTAVGLGSTVVTAKAGDKSADCAVTVVSASENITITLNKTTLNLKINDSEKLEATVTTLDGNEYAVEWESLNTQVATIDDDGLVTAVGAGTANVTATAGNKSATCVVTVSEDMTVTLNKTTLNLTVGYSEKLEATVTAPDGNEYAVEWESLNTQVATVDDDGLVTAVGAGTANVTATAGDKFATCVVTVSEDITVRLNKITLNLTMGNSEKLEATVMAPDGNEYAVRWESRNTQVATVDDDGLVTAVGVGTANITATAGNKSVTCIVTVSPLYIRITGVEVEPSTHTMEIGEEIQLSVSINPSNATSREVIWYSKDIRKATVDMVTGLVKAVDAGSVTIVAETRENEDIKDSCVIVINQEYVPVDEIVLDKTEITLTENGTAHIQATVNPSNATNRTVEWTSQHPDIAAVDENGNVTAVSPGTVVITAQADGKSASCNVTVNEQEGQTVDIPDPVFKEFLLARFDSDENGEISTAEISKVTRLDCRTQNITSLIGIEYFESLEELLCRDNKISSIDLSRNTKLKYVDCRNNEIDVLDVSLLTKLETLVCDENELEELTVSHNALLKKLSCAGNKISTLDVSHNAELYDFNCSDNKLTVIDISDNSKLAFFMCSKNDLSGEGLNISENGSLNELQCAHCGLTDLDLSHNPKLTWLYCNDNDLQALDISGNEMLSSLFCHNNKISGELDMSKLKNIDGFDCTSNEIVKIYISQEVKDAYDSEIIKIFRYDPSVVVEVK